MKTTALIVAAGEGQRCGGSLPKQYQIIGGRPMLWHSVRTFLDHPAVDAVRVVMSPSHHALYNAALQGLDIGEPVEGGATRQESVRKGLEALAEDGTERVLIHDAARPLVGAAVIGRVLEALTDHLAVIPVTPVVDTLKRVAGDEVQETVAREELRAAQTPQGFHFRYIHGLHTRYGEDAALTDDASLAEHEGLEVHCVAGEERNRKMTTPEDMAWAEAALRGPMQTRSAMGFDVHVFIEPRRQPVEVMICGVSVPHDHQLEGHSDADVGLHALTDAVLGTLAAEDIGHHFPPDDPQWKGQDSAAFLRHALFMLKEAGGTLVHADVTIIGEAPKIAPHRTAMRTRLAEITGLPLSAVSVKATTTERLGFLGRRQGLAAQAIVTVELPAPLDEKTDKKEEERV